MRCRHCGDQLRGRRQSCRRRDPFFQYEHTKHLGSDEWAAMRRAVLKARGGKCERCGEADGLEVHHKNYCRLGNERLSDLLLLCGRCHEQEHVAAAIARKRAAAEEESTWLPPAPPAEPAPPAKPQVQADLFARAFPWGGA